MASVIVEIVGAKICEMAVETAVHKVAEEANLVLNFRKDLLWLNKKLTFIRGFLQDADEQSRHKEAVKKWVESIRDIAMHVEDIFEECAVEPQGPHISVTGFFNAQSRRAYFSRWIFRYRMGRKIKNVKERIGSITEQANQLRLHRQVLVADEALSSTSQIAAVEYLKRSYLLPSDSHPVGIESKVDGILNLLNNPAFPVIAVVGMGGIGKTYLLQNVFNKAKERYEKCIWLSVSQSYSISMLQKDLVFQLDTDLSEEFKNSGISDQVLAQLIRENLQDKRCLVVLDDVWRARREEDFLTRLGLPSGNNSLCKIVVTTQSKVVSTNLNAKMYEMKHMSDEESWRLFCVYAFGGFEENIEPQQLKEVGRKIVKQCGNLPLAVKTIAASLSSTTILSKWELKLRQLEQVIISVGDNEEPIMGILKLSYDSLPARLKACFAYLSFFPEDEKIDPEYLVNLWIGEGFIPAGEDQLDVAWDSLHQLANLCLLEISEDSNLKYENEEYYYELTKHCKIHDLLLDLAIHISKENKCALSVEEASTYTSDGDGTGWCRVLLAKKDVDYYAISESHPLCLRTFTLSQNSWIRSIPENLFMAMRGLRVLDLSFTDISTLPASVGKMKLLKVLNLRDTQIAEVPKCVRQLKSLLFLALPDRQNLFPPWISELRCLQHLECKSVSCIPKGISKLASLRTLRTRPLQLSNSIEGEELMRLEDLVNMTQLQELWLDIQNVMELMMIEERGILANLVKMRRLVVQNGSGIDLPHIPENMTAMKHLESLRLRNFGVPSWTCDLANLKELELRKCECSDYPELQRMPNLVWLSLNVNGRCRELPKAFGKSGGFPRLRFFIIVNFSKLEEFPELEEGAMACLEKLEIVWCDKVKKVGEGLEWLKRLEYFSCRSHEDSEWWETLKAGGKYWNKIKAHNPEVNIDISRV